METQDQIKEIISEMNELSKKLGCWPGLKQKYKTASTIPEEKQEKKHRKIIKKYNELLPIREKVRVLKAQKEALKLEAKMKLQAEQKQSLAIKGQVSKGYSSGFFKHEVQSAIWAKRR